MAKRKLQLPKPGQLILDDEPGDVGSDDDLNTQTIETLLQCITTVYNRFELSRAPGWQCKNLYDVARVARFWLFYWCDSWSLMAIEKFYR